MFLPLLLVAAPFAAVELDIEVDGVAVDAVADVVIELSDDTNVLLEHTATGVVIVAGAAIINDLDLGALPPTALDAPLFFRVSALGLSSRRAPLPTVPHAAWADVADEALFATTAAALGGVPAEAYATQNDLAIDNGLGIPFENLRDVPASIADGVDDGTARSLDVTLAISGGQLVIAPSSLRAQHFAPGAIGTAALQDGAVTADKLAVSIGSTQLAAASIVDVDFAAGSIGAAQVAGTEVTLFRVTSLACEQLDVVTTDSTCVKRSGCASTAQRSCSTGNCTLGIFSSVCANTAIGSLIAP